MKPDTVVSLHPYFKIHSGKIDAFKNLCQRFVEKTKPETGCLYYSFLINGDVAYCREGYHDAAALLHHADSVGELIQEALTMSDLVRIEACGPAAELDKLRERLAPLNADFFAFEAGFRS